MKYFKESNGTIRALESDGSQDFLIEPYWVAMTEAEAMAELNPPAPESTPIKIFSVREFRARFTQQEQLGIRSASMTDHEVGLVYDEFLSAQYINLDDPAVEQGVNLYIAKGLIDPARKSEILAPSMPE